MYRMSQMKFLCQDFEKLEHEQDTQTDTHRHTDRRDRKHYHAAFECSNDLHTVKEKYGILCIKSDCSLPVSRLVAIVYTKLI